MRNARFRSDAGARLALALALFCLTALGCASTSPPPPAAAMSRAADEQEAVRRVVADVAHFIDKKRWVELRSLYADQVSTDYTSLFGGTPQKQAGDALIAGWRGVLEKVQTQHLLGPILVDSNGETATARCHVRALHRATGAPSGEQWEVLGHYVFTLARAGSNWKITAMTLETLLQTGNAKLLAEAAAAASR